MVDYIKEKHYEYTDSGVRVWGVYHIDNSACPSCITQLVLGIKETKDPIKCFYNGLPGTSADISFDVTVPYDRIPSGGGTITIRKCWQYTCDAAINEYKEKDAGLELFFVQIGVPKEEGVVEKHPGDRITIGGEVRNVSSVDINDLKLKVRLNGSEIGTISIGYLGVNEGYSFWNYFTIPDISEGTYDLKFDALDGEEVFQKGIDSGWNVKIVKPEVPELYYTINIFNISKENSDLDFDIKVTRSDNKMEKIKIYLKVTGGGYTWNFGEEEIYTGNTYSYGATYFCTLAGSGTIHVEIVEGELKHISKDKSVSC